MHFNFRKIKMVLLVALTALMLLFAGGSSMSVDVLKSGSGDVSVAVRKEKVADDLPDLNAFKTYFNGYVAAMNSKSTDTDALSVKGYSEDEDYYRATVSTRRLDNIGGLGTIRYGTTKSYVTTNTKYLDDIEYAYQGFMNFSLQRVYADGDWQTHKMTPQDNALCMQAKTVDGETLTFNAFKSELLKTDDNHILYFQMAEFSLIDEITLKLPGKVKFVSVLKNTETDEELGGIEVNGSTVTLTPVSLNYSKTVKNEQNENETVTYQLDSFFGYFVYEKGVSGWAIAGIVIGVLALGAFVWFGIVKGGVKRFFKGDVWRRMKRYKALYLLLLPAFILLILFRYMPMVWLSAGFMEYNLLSGLSSEWVGLKWFEGVFYATNEAAMYRIFRNTIFISLIRIVSNLPVILFLAILVNSIKNRAGRTAFQAVSFIPYFLSWVSVGGIFNAFLDPNSGIINRMFEQSVNWYGDPDPWWAILSISSLWKGMGWGTLIYISAMCNIDTELYEACSLDGGGLLRQTFTVTLPGIMNIICLQLILDVSNIMRDNYEQILAMTNGQVTGTIQETVDVVGRIAYTAMFKGNYGSATAIGLIQGVIGSLLVLITNQIVKKTDNEGII